MRQLTIGVDPDLHGGIAILEANAAGWPSGHAKPLALVPMPVIRPGKTGRYQYDVPRIRELLRRAKATGSCRAFVEKLHSLPPKIARGGIANFNRGGALRGFEFAFGMLEIPLELVLPRVWQREMHRGTTAGDTKQRSILAAQRLFPGIDLRPTERSRKPSDGLADALLICEYGRRRAAKVWDEAAALKGTE